MTGTLGGNAASRSPVATGGFLTDGAFPTGGFGGPAPGLAGPLLPPPGRGIEPGGESVEGAMGVEARMADSTATVLIAAALLLACAPSRPSAPAPVPPGPGATPSAPPSARQRPTPPLSPLTPVELRDALYRLHYRAKYQPAFCQSLTGYAGLARSCESRLVGGGLGLLLRLVTECGDAACQVHGWLLRHPEAAAERLPDVLGAEVAFDAELTFLVADRWGIPSGVGHTELDNAHMFSLFKVDLRTGSREPFASCMSPRLSPGGKWFVCRDSVADVVRIPVGGGETELVAKNLEQEPYQWNLAEGVYPAPVEFQDGKMRFGVLPGNLNYAQDWLEDASAAEPTIVDVPRRDPPLPLAERLRRCRTWEEAEALRHIATLCGSNQDDWSQGSHQIWLSSDGTRLALLVARYSGLASDFELSAVAYRRSAHQGWRPRSELLIYEAGPEGDPLMSQAQSRAAARRLNAELTRGRYRALIPIWRAEAGIAPVGGWVRLPTGEQVLLTAPRLRALRDGEVLLTKRIGPAGAPPYCCGVLPDASGAWPADAVCARAAYIEAAWYAPSVRLLVVQTGNDSGPDGCEQPVEFELIELPSPPSAAP